MLLKETYLFTNVLHFNYILKRRYGTQTKFSKKINPKVKLMNCTLCLLWYDRRIIDILSMIDGSTLHSWRNLSFSTDSAFARPVVSLFTSNMDQLEHRTTMSTIQNLSETSLVIQLDKQHIISDKHHLHCLNKTSICLATSWIHTWVSFDLLPLV